VVRVLEAYIEHAVDDEMDLIVLIGAAEEQATVQ
jgi:hypothetical protein